MRMNLKDGRKASASRHRNFAHSLANAAVVFGTLFWCMGIIVAVVHLVILKKSDIQNGFSV